MTSTCFEPVVAFKHAALVRYQEAIVRLALDRHFVSPDDLTDENRPLPGDRASIPGNAWRSLRKANVLRYADEYHDPDAGVFHGRRISKREEAKGREVRHYTLCSRAIGLTFLERNGCAAPPDGQLRLAM